MKNIYLGCILALLAGCESSGTSSSIGAAGVDSGGATASAFSRFADTSPLKSVAAFNVGDVVRVDSKGSVSESRYLGDGVWEGKSSKGVLRTTRYQGDGNFVERVEDGRVVNGNSTHGGWLPSDGRYEVGHSWSHAFTKRSLREPSGYSRRRECSITEIAGEFASISCRNKRADRRRAASEVLYAHIPTKLVVRYVSPDFSLDWKVVGYDASGST